MADHKTENVPPEAARIMERLGRTPPQQHKDMPKKRNASVAGRSPRRPKALAAS